MIGSFGSASLNAGPDQRNLGCGDSAQCGFRGLGTNTERAGENLSIDCRALMSHRMVRRAIENGGAASACSRPCVSQTFATCRYQSVLDRIKHHAIVFCGLWRPISKQITPELFSEKKQRSNKSPADLLLEGRRLLQPILQSLIGSSSLDRVCALAAIGIALGFEVPCFMNLASACAERTQQVSANLVGRAGCLSGDGHTRQSSPCRT